MVFLMIHDDDDENIYQSLLSFIPLMILVIGSKEKHFSYFKSVGAVEAVNVTIEKLHGIGDSPRNKEGI